MPKRFERLHGTPLSDNRTPPQIDRDRVLYTAAFRRLASVTQVVGADSTYVFHNRLTHSLQVAQVARRTAELLISVYPSQSALLCPDVCETAALSHDIGHPPFGHLAEETLNRLAVEQGLSDGFEGNAQSFRIVTKLAANDATCEGLDLTCATLNAILKYPWRKGRNSKYPEKWGAYDSEAREFTWARRLAERKSLSRSLEAQIMDWADDVTYSVHDVEDFYKAGLIPLDRLHREQRERERFYTDVFSRRKGKLPGKEDALVDSFENLAQLWSGFDAYSGRFLERQTLKALASHLIGDFITTVKLDESSKVPDLALDSVKKNEIFMLKELTWHYVILNPALKTQQRGQRLVISGLFEIYLEAINQGDFNLFPPIYRERLEAEVNGKNKRSSLIRTMVDMIAGMTESQAIHMYHRLNGTALGSSLIHPAV